MQKNYSTDSTKSRVGSSDGASPKRSIRRWGRSVLESGWVHQETIPDELSYTQGSVPGDDQFSIDVTKAGNIAAMVEQGIKLFERGELDEAKATFARVAETAAAVHVALTPIQSRRLSAVDALISVVDPVGLGGQPRWSMNKLKFKKKRALAVKDHAYGSIGAFIDEAVEAASRSAEANKSSSPAQQPVGSTALVDQAKAVATRLAAAGILPVDEDAQHQVDAMVAKSIGDTFTAVKVIKRRSR